MARAAGSSLEQVHRTGDAGREPASDSDELRERKRASAFFPNKPKTGLHFLFPNTTQYFRNEKHINRNVKVLTENKYIL